MTCLSIAALNTPGILCSAEQYGVANRILDLCTFDITASPLRRGGIFDAIVTDPPCASSPFSAPHDIDGIQTVYVLVQNDSGRRTHRSAQSQIRVRPNLQTRGMAAPIFVFGTLVVPPDALPVGSRYTGQQRHSTILPSLMSCPSSHLTSSYLHGIFSSQADD